ncbi:MAG TPA: MFS transporter [Verrucomicrobiae bacterium]|nr:MFS transporter [Verrucomicrobiae bacterium]
MSGLRVYRELLGNRPLMRLLLGEFVSGIGDWLYIVAIFVVIYRESGDAALVGAFGGIRLLPYVILSVPAGIVADRFDRRLVLLVSDLYRGTLMVVMAVLVATGGPTLLIAALAILAASGSAFFYPAMGAYLPALARDEQQLGPANSAWASIQNFSFIVGPAIAGIVLALGSVLIAFVLNALSFVFIAVILWSLPPSRAGQAIVTATPDAGTAATAGESTPAVDVPPTAQAAPTSNVPPAMPEAATPAATTPPLQLRPLAGLTIVQLMAGFLGGGLQVITVILAIDVLKAGEQANGYLNAAIGIGGLIGGIGAGALVLRRHLGAPLLAGAIVTGVGTIALGAATTLPVALLAIAVLAAGALIIDVVGTTVFQRLVPDALRGRAVGILMAVSTMTGAAGAFLLPVLLTTYGPFESLGAAGVATIVFTILGLAMIGTAADRAPTPYEATIARVITLPLFTGIPASRLEAAMRRVVEVPVKAGEPVVRQGETADRFYIIESGQFTVTQTAGPGGTPAVLRTLGPDDVFGELGLLNRTPRTATVTADTDGLLLALDRDDFLDLVGAGGPLRGRLLGLYAGATGTR